MGVWKRGRTPTLYSSRLSTFQRIFAETVFKQGGPCVPALVAMPVDPVILPQIPRNLGLGGGPWCVLFVGTLLIEVELHDNSSRISTRTPADE